MGRLSPPGCRKIFCYHVCKTERKQVDCGQKEDSIQEDFKQFTNLMLLHSKSFFASLTVLNRSFCNISQSFILFFLSYLKVQFFPGASLISCSTWFCSPEVFDCMFLHLFTHSCASPCFTVSCLSPEMLHRLPYTLSQKTCFTGGLLDQRKLQIFRSGSRICHGAVYQMMRP